MAKTKKKIALNDRKNDIQIFDDDKLEYQSYKDTLRKIVINDIENKIKTMQILYQIREKKLYLIDGYEKFEDFLAEFVISRSQAFLYLKIYKRVLDGSVNIEDIKQKGFKSVYRRMVNLEIESKESKQNPIRPLRFQLKSEDSYKFYKNHAKFTGFVLDKLFLNKQELLQEFLNEFENLKSRKRKEEIIE
ncbi:permease (plasmid) [Borrelia turcica IST7]|uniref:Permease n=1 Tax=Borrelia turcica IST7 TaxID=1104446 RepID=A0A386PNK8_9SPIR|nr:chromosome replication/partitioning protein [Borrelia turcica]AYE37061.1 permease [Borrelia turcica IST7]